MMPLIYTGTQSKPAERVVLRAGEFSAVFENGALRYLKLGNDELLRGIYAAVRDENWGTVPAQLRDVTVENGDNSFTVRFTSHHQRGAVDYVWEGVITGMPDSLTFTFDGKANSSFKSNRTGFCVLHAMSAAGAACVVEHTDGVLEEGSLPREISPHQPFFDLRAVTHIVHPALKVNVRMEGDTFEMEDQRNWTDASFKTYCTPLSRPFPVLVEAGSEIHQRITVRWEGTSAVSAAGESLPVLTLSAETGVPLPPIGLGSASHGEKLSPLEVARLKTLRLDHLRFDLHFTPGWAARLQGAMEDATQIANFLELAVHFSAGAVFNQEVEQLCRFLNQRPLVGWLIIFRAGEIVTRTETFEVVREQFTAHCEQPYGLGLGTDAFFTQLNRDRPAAHLEPSLIVYSVNPQVHAFDNASLVETISGMAATVESARRFAGSGTAIAVSPITFKMRWNPNATAAEAPPLPGVLPRQVDPRQMSLFGAGWTMGVISSLAAAGASSLTFYETTGWLGVMEREHGSEVPELFPSIPGGVFPLYHIFADVGELDGVRVLGLASTHPLNVSGLALQSARGLRLLVANHQDRPQRAVIDGISGALRVKVLDETTAEQAMRDPEGYRLQAGTLISVPNDGRLEMDLPPYAVIRLDQENAL